MVQICGEDDEIWYGYLHEVDIATRICKYIFTLKIQVAGIKERLMEEEHMKELVGTR